VRTLSGLGMDIGIFFMLINFYMTALEPSPLPEVEREKNLAPAAAD
jgi:hypothetical protein